MGEADAPAAENVSALAATQADYWLNRLAMRFWAGPGRPVDRRLREGDEVAGFKVLDVPGHSAGHVAFWRESDRVLILGDVLNNMNVTTGIPGSTSRSGSSPPIRRRTGARRTGWPSWSRG